MGTASPGEPPPVWLVYALLALFIGGPIAAAWAIVLVSWP